jgi:hypothetical protein
LWEEGDWDGNQQFDSSDMVAAFVGGGYELGKKEAVAASVVPEPASALLIVTGLLTILATRQRVRHA